MMRRKITVRGNGWHRRVVRFDRMPREREAHTVQRMVRFKRVQLECGHWSWLIFSERKRATMWCDACAEAHEAAAAPSYTDGPRCA